MVALAAGISTSIQVSLIRQRLEAARREESQAEADVGRLRAQTDAAENKLQERKDNVNRLSSQSTRSDPTYRSSLQSSGAKLPVPTLPSASDLVLHASGSFPNANTASSTGQAIGNLIHVTA
jgi:hypothetical protein